MSNLIAADLLGSYPQADEVELVFTVSTASSPGRAGRVFAHRGLTAVSHHRTSEIPLPSPFGKRRCLGFAEPDRGWLGTVAEGRTVSPYVCVAEAPIHAALLAANRTRLVSMLPRPRLRSSQKTSNSETGSSESVAHWIAVSRGNTRLAARTLECRGDYRGAAAATAVFARTILDRQRSEERKAGVFDPEELVSIRELSDPLSDSGITIVDQRIGVPTPPSVISAELRPSKVA